VLYHDSSVASTTAAKTVHHRDVFHETLDRPGCLGRPVRNPRLRAERYWVFTAEVLADGAGPRQAGLHAPREALELAILPSPSRMYTSSRKQIA
jgi:hypothetical protein